MARKQVAMCNKRGVMNVDRRMCVLYEDVVSTYAEPPRLIWNQPASDGVERRRIAAELIPGLLRSCDESKSNASQYCRLMEIVCAVSQSCDICKRVAVTHNEYEYVGSAYLRRYQYCVWVLALRSHKPRSYRSGGQIRSPKEGGEATAL